MVTARAAGGILFLMAVHLPAQGVTPVIYLSAAESVKVKQSSEALKNAEVRNRSAIAAWQNFDRTFRAAHPEIGNLIFSSDFRYAVARTPGAYGLGQATAIELSAEERRKGQAAYREMQESQRAFDEAQNSWADTWHQLVFDHVPFTSGPGVGWTDITLPGGAAAKIPSPWINGVALTPDYRIAVPQ